jgi:hypothetical protein
VDAKPPQGKIFYRVFVAFEGGDYVFSRSYRPVIDTTKEVEVAEKDILKKIRTRIKKISLTKRKMRWSNPLPTGFCAQ